MNILLLGSGGREHALAWKLAQSRAIEKDAGTLFAAPGNPGIARYAELVDLSIDDMKAVAGFCVDRQVGLVVIGPEAPLVAGLADRLRSEGLAVFGPSKAAAQLEGSKSFTKDLCARAGIPTAAYVHATSLNAAVTALDTFSAPYVLKADGLAGGKGVVIAETRAEAEAALADMFGGAFGSDALGTDASVVIEEFMRGEEASFFALTDGATIMAFGTAQDHKRVGDGDTGPNTGGMGAYSPATIVTPELRGEIIRRIIAPTVHQLAEDGTPYSGVLYAGLMLTDEGPRLVEYNCRFGDPECQVLMMRFEGDLAEYMLACAESRLATMDPARFKRDTALIVVLAAQGYPDTPRRGGAIGGIAQAEANGALVFHAGTEADADDMLRACGGRVLGATATGSGIGEAREKAYRAVGTLDFPDGFCRKDIGWREVERAGKADNPPKR